jgi:enterochelin esterase-like enzyme/sugar lactone lactonase YvrE
MHCATHARSFRTAIHKQLIPLVVGACLCLATSIAMAEDWGFYSIVSASAPALVLESAGATPVDGAVVTVGKPSGAANQRWVIVPKDGGWFAIKPSYASPLALTVVNGGTTDTTPVALETDKGEAWQTWRLQKHDGGNYSFIAKHSPDKGLDHLGGVAQPGAKIDLFTYHAGDQHLEWIVKPLAGSAPTSASAVAEVAAYVAPEIKPEEIRAGEVKTFAFTESKIFPGTRREVAVFIPAQYDASKPACVYVRFDGYNPKEKTFLETMIATKEIPVMVGVFVRPGDLPASIPNSMGRRNRCFEYDGVGDNNVRFLIDELLPYVEKEYSLKLSHDGNDRCITGISSGGIAAFNTAWERPEAFSRVYANSGSFVAFRGGHEFPTLIRKFEAKPIRAYLTTGMRDMENCAGDWYLLDQEMDKALKFSGYDYVFRTINGGHGAGYHEHWQEAMAYLWKDWPQPVKAGPSAPRAQDVLAPDETWQLLAADRHAPRGAASNASGEVFFTQPADNKIYRIDLDGNVSAFATDAGQANSLSFGPAGQLYSVSSTTGKIMSYDSSASGTLVADGLRGQHILAHPNGGLYVTTNGDSSGDAGAVWFVKDGKKTLVDSGLKLATGLAYRPDQWLLSVADGRSKWAYSYQINSDGSLTNKERFFWLHVADWEDDAGADSVCYAKEGQMLVATRSGIEICADDGPTQVILPLPDRSRVASVCLGGRDQDTLFAFSGDKIWKRKVKIHAIGAFSPWTKVNGTKL